MSTLLLIYIAVLVTIVFHRTNRHSHCRSVAVELSLIINGEKVKQMTNIKDDLVANISVEADDRFGNAVGALETPPTYALSDPSFGDLTVSADGMSAQFTSNGKLGTVQLTVSAIVGGNTLNGQTDLNIIAGSASTLKINVAQ